MPNIPIKPPPWMLDRIDESLAIDDERHLIWTKPRSKRVKTGDKAGSQNKKGYWCVGISKKGFRQRVFRVHHIVWYLTTGEWPSTEIDHKDYDPSNNTIGNLRAATGSQNCMNQTVRVTNKIGEKNICMKLDHGKHQWFYVQILRKGKHVFRKRFKKLEDAIKARDEALAKYHGDFART